MSAINTVHGFLTTGKSAAQIIILFDTVGSSVQVRLNIDRFRASHITKLNTINRQLNSQSACKKPHRKNAVKQLN